MLYHSCSRSPPDLHSFPTRRSSDLRRAPTSLAEPSASHAPPRARAGLPAAAPAVRPLRSEEHTSELQSLRHLVCRLLLEKKNTNYSANSVHQQCYLYGFDGRQEQVC